MRTTVSAKTTQNKIMKPNYRKISGTLAAMTFAFIGFAVSLQAATLSDQDKQFLTAYGKAHDALVADDLGGAKKGADRRTSS
jgi:hypothetical protein